MTGLQALRHILGAIAAGLVPWLAEQTGLEIQPEALVAIGLGVYATVEKGMKRWTAVGENEGPTGEQHADLVDLMGDMSDEIAALRDRLPPRCEYTRGVVPCTFAKDHEPPHSFEVSS